MDKRMEIIRGIFRPFYNFLVFNISLTKIGKLINNAEG